MRTENPISVFQSALRAGSLNDLAEQARATAVEGCMATAQAVTSLRISSTSRAQWGMMVVLAEACTGRLRRDIGL
jgi:hypothetical protein